MSDSSVCEWRSTSDSDNLTGLTELNQKTLLDAIKKRYMEDRIYTDVGDILVAVNPFCSLPLYSSSCSAAFSQPDQSSMAPHIFKSAGRAYNAMVQAKRDQVCVISGESGAGKTESAKLIMKQVYCCVVRVMHCEIVLGTDRGSKIISSGLQWTPSNLDP